MLLPNHHLADEEIKNQALQYLKERGIESFKEKTMARIILDLYKPFHEKESCIIQRRLPV